MSLVAFAFCNGDNISNEAANSPMPTSRNGFFLFEFCEENENETEEEEEESWALHMKKGLVFENLMVFGFCSGKKIESDAAAAILFFSIFKHEGFKQRLLGMCFLLSITCGLYVK